MRRARCRVGVRRPRACTPQIPAVAVHGDRAETLAVVGGHSERRLAQPRRLFEHRVEHRREIAGRGIDDPQYLGGGGLLVERFLEFGGAVVDLLFQFGVGFCRSPAIG